MTFLVGQRPPRAQDILYNRVRALRLMDLEEASPMKVANSSHSSLGLGPLGPDRYEGGDGLIFGMRGGISRVL